MFDTVLANSLSSEQKLITEVSSHIIYSGGKRIRPLLTIIASKMLGAEEPNNKQARNSHINLAVAVELIHTATLLHDDVVDEGELRRGNITANSKWNSKTSILVGDYLFSQAFKLMSLSGCARTLNILSSAAVKIAEGEVNQLVKSIDINLSLEDYLTVISGKTAELFGAATAVAAPICNHNEIAEDKLRDFGFNLGILFQVIDDYIDYFGSSSQTGKKIGVDYFANKVTLPIILLLDKMQNNKKDQLKELFYKKDKTSQDLNYIIQSMEEFEVKTEIYNFIDHYYQKSLKGLLYFSDCEARQILLEILEFSRDRNY
jgi:octaprenyl-diphosphate synthase